MTELQPILRRSFEDPDRARVQDLAIASVEANTERHLAVYAADPRSFEGRYIAADLFKETFPEYAASKDARNRYNSPVHNAAAVLSAEQFRRVIERSDDPGRDTVVLLTGIPGAGKTSTVLAGGMLASNVRAVFEGQLVRPETTIPKVQQVLDAGLKPVIVAVHATPENALRNTLRRFDEEGRGASIGTMADIQGGLPAGLRAVRDHFGAKVELNVVDVRDRTAPRRLAGWDNIDVLASEGNHERITQRLRAELDRVRGARGPDDAGNRQALGKRPLDRSGPDLESRSRVDGQDAAGHQTHGDGRSISARDRAEAFLRLPRDEGLRRFPDLAGAYSTLDAVRTQGEARGISGTQLTTLLNAARRQIARGIEGEQPTQGALRPGSSPAKKRPSQEPDLGR